MSVVVPVDELRALARAVALDADLEVTVGEPGSGWFIHPGTSTIHVDGHDLAHEHPDDVRGLVCHEAAHAAVTRYLHLVPKSELETTGMASLLNSLEDCRIEDWLARRYPGTAAWIERYNDRLFPVDAEGLDLQPWFRQYCIGAIHAWWHGVLPKNLHPEPLAALEATAEARRAYVAAEPPVDPDVSFDEAGAYDSSRVAHLYAANDRFAPPDGFERVVRLRAYGAWRIVWQQIRPVYLDLVARDREHQQRMKEHERAFLRLLGELRNGAAGRARRRVRVPADARGMPPGAPMSPGESRPDDAPIEELSPELRRAVEEAVAAKPTNTYDEARQEVAPLADRLFDELDRILRPQSYPRWVRGYPTGSRLDLRAAMSFEVEPGGYLRLWERKTLPKKRDPAFLFLLDLSGSMSGERIHHGFRGAVLVAEVLERLQVPFAVHGFQDVLVPFKDFDQPLDEACRRRLGGMPAEVAGNRPGGRNRPQHNYDGPALIDAAERLLAQPAGDRLLIVASDGEPSGPEDGEGALRRAVRQIVASGVKLIGVGIGPGTDHVARYYPDYQANVPLESLPRALGGAIEAQLRR